MKKHVHSYNLQGVGTGTWWTLETIAYHTDTAEKLGYFAHTVEIIANNFVCVECKEHFQQFIQLNPVDKYILDYRHKFNRYAAFQWIWEAHNNANELTGKIKVSYHDALSYQEKLASGEACENCSVIGSHGSHGSHGSPQSYSPQTQSPQSYSQNQNQRNRGKKMRVKFHDI